MAGDKEKKEAHEHSTAVFKLALTFVSQANGSPSRLVSVAKLHSLAYSLASLLKDSYPGFKRKDMHSLLQHLDVANRDYWTHFDGSNDMKTSKKWTLVAANVLQLGRPARCSTRRQR